MICGYTPYEPAFHCVRKTPFTDFLRKELRSEDIFVMWNRISRNWVVCAWTKMNGLRGFWAIRVLNKDPDGDNPQLTPRRADQIRKRWFSPDDPKDLAKAVRNQDSAVAERAAEQDLAHTSRMQFMGRKVNPVLAARSPLMSAALRRKRLYG